MKLNFLKYRTNLLLKNNKSSRENVPYKEAQQLGVIFTVEDKVKHEAVKDFIKRFEQDGKKIQVIEYLPPDRQNYEFKFNFFSDKDFSFWGNITSNDAVKFANIRFDYLFYLDTSPNPLILHLLAMSQARCRVGRSWDDNQSYFEFMVESPDNVKEMIDTMHKYTIQLK